MMESCPHCGGSDLAHGFCGDGSVIFCRGCGFYRNGLESAAKGFPARAWRGLAAWVRDALNSDLADVALVFLLLWLASR